MRTLNLLIFFIIIEILLIITNKYTRPTFYFLVCFNASKILIYYIIMQFKIKRKVALFSLRALEN